ncbi:MAG: hypothetical protein AMJ69_09190, partial [Gammaproteobacteria bacterium SG8_47]
MRQRKKKPLATLIHEELESRILLSVGVEGLLLNPDNGDADAGADWSDADSDPLALALTPTSYNPDARQELIIIDPSVDAYDALVQDILTSADASREFQIVVLDPTQDGVAQITDILGNHQDLDAVHIVSHGSDGSVILADTQLNAVSLVQYSDAIGSWSNALDADADLLFYGCNLAAGAEGQALVDAMSSLTGADVAASDDLTGHAELGGDWELEYRAGVIDTSVAFTSNLQESFADVLATETVLDQFNGTNYNANDGSQNWNGGWSESGDAGNPAQGNGVIQIVGGELRIGGSDDTNINGISVARAADLTGATTATLTFDYSRQLFEMGSGGVSVQVSGNGSGWTTLDTYTFSGMGAGSASFDISAYAAADTAIRFVGSGTSVSAYFFADNVQIEYDGNQAPIANADSGAAFTTDQDTSFTTGDVLGNDTDPDVGDTLTVQSIDTTATLGSVFDNGDGTFDYDPNGAFDTLAAGESATDTFTYTVSDGNGGTSTAGVTITVNGANDGPSLATTITDTNATEDSAFNYDISASFADVDATDTLTYAATLVGGAPLPA